MVDTNGLRAEIARKGLAVQNVAKEIGIDKNTLYLKMKTGNFTLREATAITELLDLEDPARIFFANQLS